MYKIPEPSEVEKKYKDKLHKKCKGNVNKLWVFDLQYFTIVEKFKKVGNHFRIKVYVNNRIVTYV